MASHKSGCRIHNTVLSVSKAELLLFPVSLISLKNKNKSHLRTSCSGGTEGRLKVGSRSRAPADHKESTLKLSQVDPHLCTVTCLPHPDLIGANRADHTADLSVLF